VQTTSTVIDGILMVAQAVTGTQIIGQLTDSALHAAEAAVTDREIAVTGSLTIAAET